MKLNPQNNTPLFVISGASGSGKTSICHKIADAFGFYYSISHTSRSQREKEKNGEDYYFISEDEFKTKIKYGDFIEWALVYDNYYGTCEKIILNKLEQNIPVIMDLDTKGALNLKSLYPENAVLIFIETESLDELKKRLLSRNRDTLEDIEKRLSMAKDEIAKKERYDYVVLNKDFDVALSDVSKIVNKNLNTK